VLGSAEAKVICVGIIKRLLIAYCIGSISARKKILKSLHVCQSYSRAIKVGRFLRHTEVYNTRHMSTQEIDVQKLT